MRNRFKLNKLRAEVKRLCQVLFDKLLITRPLLAWLLTKSFQNVSNRFKMLTTQLTQHQMDRQDVSPLEQLVLGNQDCARGFGGLGRHVLAPGDQIHSKSAPDPRDL